ncbi:DUF2690 domain-containing protein [Streptomyces sp. NPDC047000]|uniref:helix-turn-helix domain-containing protein n=1 Tax=Streptomyces sp. NPDC047000 TaxID=3155474 RepID=UPI00340FA9D5
MGRRQGVRGDAPAEVVRLVRELRRYVDRCGMNTATVARKTGYSRSSWLRYLNGRRLPPWAAVAELGGLAQADAEHLRVLWESAAHAWSQGEPAGGRAAPPAARGPAGGAAAGDPPVTDPQASTDPPHPPGLPYLSYLSHGARRGGVPAAAAAVCALLAAVLLARPWSTWTDTGHPPAGAPSGAPAWPWPLRGAADQAAAACRPGACRGLDPYREGCDRDGVVVHRLRAYGHVLTLQYSPVCRASWAEVDNPAATAGLRVATTGGDRQGAATGGGDRRGGAAGGAYTAMVAGGPDTARATVVVAGHQLGVARYDSWIDAVTATVTGRG